jgi:hypothetical protein
VLEERNSSGATGAIFFRMILLIFDVKIHNAANLNSEKFVTNLISSWRIFQFNLD